MGGKIKQALHNIVNKEEGSTIIIAAIALVAVLSFCAVVVDVGVVYAKESELQTAVDAAALAEPSMLPNQELAQQTAVDYLEKNNISTDGIEVSFDTDNIIRVKQTYTSDAYFANVLGQQFLYAEASAAAQKYLKSIGGPFDYRLFSGDNVATLNMGGKFTIYGSVHANGSVSASPSYGLITGSVESCNNLYVNPYTTTVGTKVNPAPVIQMVDFTSVVAEVVPTYFTTILTASQVNSEWRKQYFYGNTKITGTCSISNQAVIDGNLFIDGDLTINGGAPACVLNGSIYATGKITFNNTFSGNGCVFANGNITFNGGGAILNAANPICMYSKTGSIYLNTATSEISGIIYAPNGTVSVVGGTTTFYGSIIGNKIAGIPADLVMKSPNEPFDFMPSTDAVRLIE